MILSNGSLGQAKNQFGIELGFGVLPLHAPIRISYFPIERLEIKIGLDGNSTVTLGRNLSIGYQFVRFKKNKNTLIAGLSFDSTSKGVHSWNESGKRGTYSIPQNLYLIPSIGFRLLGVNNTKNKIFKALGITLNVEYKIPLQFQPVTYRNGDFSSTHEIAINNAINHGFRFSLKVGWWLGSKSNNALIE